MGRTLFGGAGPRLRCGRWPVLLLAAAFGVWTHCGASDASAQPTRSSQKQGASRSQSRPATTKRDSPRRKPASKQRAERKAESRPKPGPASAGSGPAAKKPAAAPNVPEPAGQIRTEGDTQVKVMEFRGLDIEGQLKTPQMLYFLNRMRAEFGRPRLPHRSFMPELSSSTQERVF